MAKNTISEIHTKYFTNDTHHHIFIIKNMRNGNCINLISKSYESFYWLGFLLADGHFSNNGSRLTIAIHNKDIDHLNKLSKFLNNPKVIKCERYDHSKISIMHTDILQQLCKTYNIKSNKTYQPPNISHLSEDEIFCLSVGFIDGDGSIGYQYKRKDAVIRIQCHSSWIENLQIMYPQAKIKINKRGYSRVSISNSIDVKNLKTKAIKYQLPMMQRKWNKIDLDNISKYEKSKLDLEKIKQLYDQGYSVNDISHKLNIKYCTVYMKIKRKLK